MHRLLLRFGNQQADTIAEHETVLRESPHVWWGWWGKAWERIPQAHGDEIVARAKAGTPVGLFDRRALRFYLADCDDAHLAADGARIPSPEPASTPGYYSDRYFPGWFRFTSLTEVSERDFIREFGFVPSSQDETLYWSDPSSPPEQHTLDVVRTRSSTILHLSDLHFGDDHAFGRTAGPAESPLSEVITRYVRDSRTDVGIVVVTGDLVTRGAERYFRDVTRFFDELLSGLGLDKDHLVVVPGNHDLWLDDDATFTYSHDYAHELGYRDWFDGYFANPNAKLSLERLKVFDCDSGNIRVAFAQVNSARLREKETMEFGYVGAHRYLPLLRAMSEIDDERLYRLFVMHHHLIPVPPGEHVRPGRPISVTVDAGQIVENLQRYGVQVVLHGHQHLPFIGSTGRMSFDEHGATDGHARPIAIIGAGSAGAVSDRLSTAWRANTFGIYSLVDSTIEARLVEFTPGGFCRAQPAIQIPLVS